MKKQELHFRFHNPNTPEATADALIKILIEANQNKVEKAIRQAAQKMSQDLPQEMDDRSMQDLT